MLELFKNYLEIEKRRSARTIDAYLDSMNDFRNYIEKNFLQVTEGDIRHYTRYLIKKNLKNSTVNQRLAGIRAFYQWLLNVEKRIEKSPIPVGLSLKIQETLVEVPTPEEVQAMIKAAKTLRDKLIISILSSSGIRLSELLKLTTVDVDADSGEIKVIKGKGNKSRRTFMDGQAKKLYQEYIVQLDGDLLFPISNRHTWFLIKTCATEAGIKKRISPHSFRHHFCVQMSRAGMSDSSLSRFTGHANVSTLARYKNFDAATQKELYEKYTRRPEKALAIV